jgi:uncharacterized protein YndB with AHSA1/START domain
MPNGKYELEGDPMLGTLNVTQDNRFALRFERRLAHSQAKVWTAITDTEQLRSWFVEILDYDRSQLIFEEGAELRFVPKDPTAPTGVGKVTQSDPPHLLEYTWDTETLRWQIEAEGDAACRLIFTNILDRHDSATAVAPGWHAALDMLSALLDGRKAESPAWEKLLDEYAHALG